MKLKVWIILCVVLCGIAFFVFQILSEKPIFNQADLSSPNEKFNTIRAAYVVCPPLFYIDSSNGEKTGVFFDVINTIAPQLNFKVNWTEVADYNEMMQGLNDNFYDMGIGYNSEKVHEPGFTVVLFYDLLSAYVRIGDKRFEKKQISNLNSSKYTISTNRGGLGALLAKLKFPMTKTLELSQNAEIEQLVQNVANGKADVVFLADTPARFYRKYHPGQIEYLRLNDQLLIFPYFFVFSRENTNLRDKINQELMGIVNNGYIDSIRLKYETLPIYGEYGLTN